jgi:AraC-like DNA-binding protein
MVVKDELTKLGMRYSSVELGEAEFPEGITPDQREELRAALSKSGIEKFYISHRIERVKELLAYNELTLTEIAYKMHCSSVSHLCTQFKKVTGQTPSHFIH